MATVKSWGGTGVAPGTVMTPAVVGTGDTAFNSLTGTAPVVQNALIRQPAIQFDQLAAAQSYLHWDIVATPTGAMRWLGLYTAAPAAAVTLAQASSGAGAQQFAIRTSNLGDVRLYNAANAMVAQSASGVFPFGSVIYVEHVWGSPAGTGTVRLYYAGSLTPFLTLTSAVLGVLDINAVRLGNLVTTTLPRWWMDDFVVTNTSATIPQAGAGPLAAGEIRPLQYNCNRVAGTLVNGVPSLDAQGAANRWAGTTGLDLVHALNIKAGVTDPRQMKELQGACNVLAGTTGLGVDGASSRWASG